MNWDGKAHRGLSANAQSRREIQRTFEQTSRLVNRVRVEDIHKQRFQWEDAVRGRRVLAAAVPKSETIAGPVFWVYVAQGMDFPGVGERVAWTMTLGKTEKDYLKVRYRHNQFTMCDVFDEEADEWDFIQQQGAKSFNSVYNTLRRKRHQQVRYETKQEYEDDADVDNEELREIEYLEEEAEEEEHARFIVQRHLTGTVASSVFIGNDRAGTVILKSVNVTD
jgi:hypothetical protein